MAKKKRRRVGSKLVCPKTFRRKKVHRGKGGSCYIKLKTGARRFVKKVKPKGRKGAAKRRCSKGIVKSGPRKGRCKKVRARRR